MLTHDDLSKIKSLMEDTVKPIDQKVDKMNKKLDVTIKYFDTVTTKHHKRIRRVEEHLQLPQIPEFA